MINAITWHQKVHAYQTIKKKSTQKIILNYYEISDPHPAQQDTFRVRRNFKDILIAGS